jgi:hypothetical protein
MVALIMVMVISGMCEVVGMRGLGVGRLGLREGFIFSKLNPALSFYR